MQSFHQTKRLWPFLPALLGALGVPPPPFKSGGGALTFPQAHLQAWRSHKTRSSVDCVACDLGQITWGGCF